MTKDASDRGSSPATQIGVIEIGENLRLKQLGLDDAGGLIRVVDRNREHLTRFLPWADKAHTTRDALDFIERSLKAAQRGEALQVGIWLGDHLIGCLGLDRIDRSTGRATVSYWIAETHQGFGYVTSSALRFFDFVFKTLALDILEIRCASSNLRSQAVARRTGARLVRVDRGSLVLRGTAVDEVVFELGRRYCGHSTATIPESKSSRREPMPS